jgi:hypothetical protein
VKAREKRERRARKCLAFANSYLAACGSVLHGLAGGTQAGAFADAELRVEGAVDPLALVGSLSDQSAVRALVNVVGEDADALDRDPLAAAGAALLHQLSHVGDVALARARSVVRVVGDLALAGVGVEGTGDLCRVKV